jgi:hypothetical protein
MIEHHHRVHFHPIPTLMSPESIGANLPHMERDQPYKAIYFGRWWLNQMSVTEISASDSTGLPKKPSRMRLARYGPEVVHSGAAARMITFIRSDIK